MSYVYFLTIHLTYIKFLGSTPGYDIITLIIVMKGAYSTLKIKNYGSTSILPLKSGIDWTEHRSLDC